MKKIYVLFISLTVLAAKAQLTESNHAPHAGLTYDTYQCDSLNIQPGNGGAGMNWVFAPATRSSIVTSYTALAASNPTYASAKVALVNQTGFNAYYKSDVNSLWYYGGTVPVPNVVATLNFTAPALMAVYPMSLNTSSTAATGGTMNVTSPFPATGTFSGTSHVIADGTGTLTLNGLAYNNITRVVTSQTINFVASLQGTVTQRTYEYFEMGIKPSIFTIATATVATSFGSPSTQTLVTRFKPLPNNTGIPELKGGEVLSVYPNPAVNEVHFLAQDKNLVLSLYDVTGKNILVTDITNGHLKLDVSSLVKGLYIYSVASPDGTVIKSGKLTVIQ